MYFPSTNLLFTLTVFLLAGASVGMPTTGSGLLGRTTSQASCSLSPPPTLPSSSLYSPSRGLKPVRVVLGRGVQNYNCDSKNSAPEAIGADATLYDVSCVVQSSFGVERFSSFLLHVPERLVQSLVKKYLPSLKVGTHFFRNDGAPTFVFDDGISGVMSKDSDAPAPAGATGNQYGDAVAWLRLFRKEGEPDKGIQQVYRVDTAGGRAPATCSKKGKLTIEYAAVYWMYG